MRKHAIYADSIIQFGGDYALIAQLDRAFDYGSKGFGFDS